MANTANTLFERDTQVKHKIEPTEGLSFWFADVPEGGVTENTYLSGYVSPDSAIASGGFPNLLF